MNWKYLIDHIPCCGHEHLKWCSPQVKVLIFFTFICQEFSHISANCYQRGYFITWKYLIVLWWMAFISVMVRMIKWRISLCGCDHGHVIKMESECKKLARYLRGQLSDNFLFFCSGLSHAECRMKLNWIELRKIVLLTAHMLPSLLIIKKYSFLASLNIQLWWKFVIKRNLSF